jgi:hypothetical protein
MGTIVPALHVRLWIVQTTAMTLWHVSLSFAGIGWAGFVTFLLHIAQQ